MVHARSQQAALRRRSKWQQHTFPIIRIQHRYVVVKVETGSGEAQELGRDDARPGSGGNSVATQTVASEEEPTIPLSRLKEIVNEACDRTAQRLNDIFAEKLDGVTQRYDDQLAKAWHQVEKLKDKLEDGDREKIDKEDEKKKKKKKNIEAPKIEIEETTRVPKITQDAMHTVARQHNQTVQGEKPETTKNKLYFERLTKYIDSYECYKALVEELMAGQGRFVP